MVTLSRPNSTLTDRVDERRGCIYSLQVLVLFSFFHFFINIPEQVTTSDSIAGRTSLGPPSLIPRSNFEPLTTTTHFSSTFFLLNPSPLLFQCFVALCFRRCALLLSHLSIKQRIQQSHCKGCSFRTCRPRPSRNPPRCTNSMSSSSASLSHLLVSHFRGRREQTFSVRSM
ncbi:hypothetical protein V8E53_002198 [Lactarius tabidus]